MNFRAKKTYRLIRELIELKEKVIRLNRTEARKQEFTEAIRRNESRLRIMLDGSDSGILITQEGRFKFFNKKLLEIIGCADQDFPVKLLSEFVYERYADNPGSHTNGKSERESLLRPVSVEDNPKVVAKTRKYSGHANLGKPLYQVFGKNWKHRWFEFNPVVIEWNGKPATLECLTDVTERIEAETETGETELLYQTLFEHANDAIFFETEKQEIQAVNERACDLFGYCREELLGMKTSELRPFAQNALLVYENPNISGIEPVEMKGIRKDGKLLDIELTVTPVITGKRIVFMSIVRDITDRKHAEERIRYLALHDNLTGLANRNLFFDRLNHAVYRGNRYKNVVGLMYIDINDFKYVNHHFGNDMGDRVLMTVAERITSSIRQTDSAARIGGDEFGIILQDMQKREYAQIVAEKVYDAITRPVSLMGCEYTPEIRIGISTYPADGESADILLKKADAAMQRAKTRGHTKCCLYDPSM